MTPAPAEIKTKTVEISVSVLHLIIPALCQGTTVHDVAWNSYPESALCDFNPSSQFYGIVVLLICQ